MGTRGGEAQDTERESDRYTPVSNRIVEFFEVSANIVSLGMRIDIVSNRDKPSDLHPYL